MIEHIQPESTKDFEDRRKVAELCSQCIVKLWMIMGQLEAIRDVVEAIDVPTLSSYKKIEETKVVAAGTAPLRSKEENEEASTVTASILPSVTTFKPPTKQSLADLTMTLARNLELNLRKKEGE